MTVSFLSDTVDRRQEDGQQAFDNLLAWAWSTGADAVPEAVLSRAAILLADELVAAMAAAHEPALARAQEVMCLSAPRDEARARVFAHPLREATRSEAAIANSVALSWMELDEGFVDASCHAGLYLVPTLTAFADASGASVRTVLGQLTLCYEVLGRLAAAHPPQRFSWHPHALWSTLGATLAACLAQEASLQVAARGMRMASSLAKLGGYEAAVDGAEVRNVWAAFGVIEGLTLHRLAQAGMDGPAGAPTNVFERLAGRPGRLAALSDGLGTQWAVARTFTKEHACCQSMHSAIDAALALRAADGFSADGIAAVEIETPRLEMNVVAPRNRLAAQFSLPHSVAAVLLYGSAAADGFGGEALDDPALRRLRERIVLKPWTRPLEHENARPARVVVTWADGARREATLPASRPMDERARRVVIEGKLDRYGAPLFPDGPATCAKLMEFDASIIEMPWRDFVMKCFKS